MKPTFFLFPIAAAMLASGEASAQKPLAPLPPIDEAAGQEKPVTRPPAPSANAAPPEVVDSAVAAVSKLGDEVVLGRFQAAIDRMNPEWKQRTAKRMGGMEELENQLAAVAQEMVRQGISMISFKPQGLPRSFEVSPGKKVEKANGVEVETLVFNKWLVLVPTNTRFRIMQKVENEAPKVITIDSTGFQVAISDKGANDWTFIDGSGLTVNDLRSMFATLPQDMELPPLEKKESR